MKVVGFTFIRNAVKYDYPIVESIKSILPICDEYIVCLGDSEDETRQLINSINSPKIKVIDSVWDNSLREGGRLLAIETNKAFDAIQDADWAFYLQGDEVVHEKYLDEIHRQMEVNLSDKEVEGLLFKYEHFYGSYDYVGDSRNWYRREIRIIRNDKSIRSYRDAQGFRKNDKKLKVKLIDAYIYHYGWVKNPVYQKNKEKNFHRLWHPDEWIKQKVREGDRFDYSGIDSLRLFEETHPAVMKGRVENMDWEFKFDTHKKRFKLKTKVLYFIEKITGVRLFEYRNYVLKRK